MTVDAETADEVAKLLVQLSELTSQHKIRVSVPAAACLIGHMLAEAPEELDRINLSNVSHLVSKTRDMLREHRKKGGNK